MWIASPRFIAGLGVFLVAACGRLAFRTVDVELLNEGGPEAALLSDPDGDAGELFGNAVAIHEDVAVVGAKLDSDRGDGSGSAFVYRRTANGWQQEAKLLADDGKANDHFGDSVAVYRDTIVVAAPSNDEIAEASGAVYVFRYDGDLWQRGQKLLDSESSDYHYFGESVAIHENWMVIGCRYDDDPVPDAGSAFIYQRNGSDWTQQAILRASDAAADDRFGVYVAVYGDVVAVGAEGDDDRGESSGSVYLFRHDGASGWDEEAKLLADDGQAYDILGVGLSVWENRVAVGAYQKEDHDLPRLDDGSIPKPGSAYVFERDGTTWVQRTKLMAEDRRHQDHFGRRVAIWGDELLVGSRFAAGNGNDSGAAYRFRRVADSWAAKEVLFVREGQTNDQLGSSVAIWGTTVIVGAPEADGAAPGSGAAYIWELEP